LGGCVSSDDEIREQCRRVVSAHDEFTAALTQLRAALRARLQEMADVKRKPGTLLRMPRRSQALPSTKRSLRTKKSLARPPESAV